MSAPPVFAGQVVGGKYRVERMLGEGGHGVVVSATHLGLGERVAIKVLRPEFAVDPEIVARFLREARAAVRIKGEHVTRVLDVGSMPDGAPYMVMEHLDGHDLGQILDARTRLPIANAVDYILQACEALAEAHGIGIVHRDMKPANLFLTKRSDGSPCIKVLDFGISKAVDAAGGANPAQPSFTQTQNVVGSPQYMAPEQMSAPKLIDRRTDIWGLGATLYELLAGHPPFNADTLPEIFARILRDVPPPIERPDLPPALFAVVTRCLEKSLERRWNDVSELAHALAPFAETAGANIGERIGRVGVIAFQSGSRLPSTSEHDIGAAFEATPALLAKKRTNGALALGGTFAFIAILGIGVGVYVVKRRAVAPPSSLVAESASVTESAVAVEPPAPMTGVAADPPVPSISDSAPVPLPSHRPRPATRPSATTTPTRPPGVASSRYD